MKDGHYTWYYRLENINVNVDATSSLSEACGEHAWDDFDVGFDNLMVQRAIQSRQRFKHCFSKMHS